MFLFPRTLGELQKWSEAIEKQRRRWAWKRKQNWTHALTFACFLFSFLPLQLSPMLLLHLPACIPQSTFKPHSFCSSPSVYLSVPQHTFIPSPVAFPQAMSAQLSVPPTLLTSPVAFPHYFSALSSLSHGTTILDVSFSLVGSLALKRLNENPSISWCFWKNEDV